MRKKIDSKELYEKLDNYVDSLEPQELLSTLSILLKEDSTSSLMNNLVDNFVRFDDDNQIIQENWDWFYNSIEQVKDEKEFINYCRQINIKLYVLRHFIKTQFGDIKYTEDELKFQLKKYFTIVKAGTKSKFVNNLYELPFEFSALLVRYIINVVIEEESDKAKYKASKALADVYLKEILQKKNNFIKEINDISLGLHSSVSISTIKELLELRTFFTYNVLNAGALEFIIRFINNKENEIQEKYGKGFSNILKEYIFSLPCYIIHIQRIKEGKDVLFFLDNGMQNKKKKLTFDDYVKKILDPKEYIPVERELDSEPIDTDLVQSEESEGSAEGDIGNGFESTSELDVEEPTSEDLL